MIETNETGQRQLDALVRNSDDLDLSDWERDFIESVGGSTYRELSRKQKGVIGDLYDKYF